MPVVARVHSPDATAAIAPLGEAARRFSFCDQTLEDLQRTEAKDAGFELVDVDHGAPFPPETQAIVTPDVLFSAACLQALVAAASDKPKQLTIGSDTPLFTFLAPLCAPGSRLDGGLRVPLFAGDFGGQTLAVIAPPSQSALDLVEKATPFVLDDTTSEDDRIDPHGPPPHLIRIPASPLVAGRITHWLHALNLGLTWTVVERRRRGAIGRKNALLGKAKIHPTALVEGSVLADGVEVEAGASVLNSYLGPKVKIADHAVFVRCAVDRDCHTLIDTHMRRVVAYEGSTLSNLGTSDLLLGRKIFITTGVAYFQPGPGQTVVVDGQDSGRGVLGGVVGHGTILGARSLLHAGMAIPSGTTVVGRPDEAISRMTDEGLARAHVQFGDPRRDA